MKSDSHSSSFSCLILHDSQINAWFVFCFKIVICQNETLEKGIENVDLLNWILNIETFLFSNHSVICHRCSCSIVEAFRYLNKAIQGTLCKGNNYKCLFSFRLLKDISYLYLYGPYICWVRSCFSYVRLFATPGTIAHQAPLPMEFSRQEYWNGKPCPPPGNLPDPGTEPAFPALKADSLPLSHWGNIYIHIYAYKYIYIYIHTQHIYKPYVDMYLYISQVGFMKHCC